MPDTLKFFIIVNVIFHWFHFVMFSDYIDTIQVGNFAVIKIRLYEGQRYSLNFISTIVLAKIAKNKTLAKVSTYTVHYFQLVGLCFLRSVTIKKISLRFTNDIA